MLPRLRAAYLRPWREHLAGADANRIRWLLDAADRLGALHRCESWRRLLEQVPRGAVAQPPKLAYWLTQAVEAGE